LRAPRIKWGMLGGGADSLIGIVHRIAAEMGDDYHLVGGVFSGRGAASIEFARDLELDPRRAYQDVDALIAGEIALPPDQRMRLLTIATPNYLHYEAAMKLVGAGFHVLCEKPITTGVAQAMDLARLVRSQGVVFAVAHTYTGYPMVRQLRAMVADGTIGAVQKVHVQYYQGWINPLLREPAKRRAVWRLDPAQGGDSSCIGDIGVHCFNLVEYTTGLRVERLLADTDTGAPDNPLDVDGSVLLRLTGNVPGVLCASQIATAEENNLQLAVYGRTGALKWAQETPQRLEFLQEGKPLSVLTAGQPYNALQARAASKLPPGHPEGFTDAMGNLYRGVARAINGQPFDPGAFPGIEDGVRGMRFIDAVLKSASTGNQWRDL
jgi:predicted dehydrogenase